MLQMLLWQRAGIKTWINSIIIDILRKHLVDSKQMETTSARWFKEKLCLVCVFIFFILQTALCIMGKG